MKSNRNRSFINKPEPSEARPEKSLLDITTILINVIAIIILVGIYYYVQVHNLYEDQQNYIYWTINVLISYNILVASARSLWAPLLSVLAGTFGIFAAGSTHAITFLTTAQCWQLAILGIIGLIITYVVRIK